MGVAQDEIGVEGAVEVWMVFHLMLQWLQQLTVKGGPLLAEEVVEVQKWMVVELVEVDQD